MELSRMSANALEALSRNADALAADLRKNKPSYALALANGVKDGSYRTVRYGWIASYSGKAEITMANGRKWRAIGHKASGSADWVEREGWIEFIPIGGDED